MQTSCKRRYAIFAGAGTYNKLLNVVLIYDTAHKKRTSGYAGLKHKAVSHYILPLIVITSRFVSH